MLSLLWMLGCGAGAPLDTPNPPPGWPASNAAAGDAVATAVRPRHAQDTDATPATETPDVPAGEVAPPAGVAPAGGDVAPVPAPAPADAPAIPAKELPVKPKETP